MWHALWQALRTPFLPDSKRHAVILRDRDIDDRVGKVGDKSVGFADANDSVGGKSRKGHAQHGEKALDLLGAVNEKPRGALYIPGRTKKRQHVKKIKKGVTTTIQSNPNSYNQL